MKRIKITGLIIISIMLTSTNKLFSQQHPFSFANKNFSDETPNPSTSSLYNVLDIGIGSTSATEARLHVFNGITSEPTPAQGNTFTATRPFLITGKYRTITGYDGAIPIYSPGHRRNFFTVDYKGEVGIGVLNPLTKLHLDKGVFTITDGTLEETSARWEIHGDSKSFAVKDKLVDRYRFWIDRTDDGNVGIGTTFPLEKLQVEGNLLVNNGFLNVQTSSGYIKMYSANSLYAHFLTDLPDFYFNKSIHVNGGVSSYSTNDLELQTNGSTKMTVKTTGQVDIGALHINAGPHVNYKLSVDGTIIGKKVVVTLDNWADHVFEKNYELKPLSEVEAFIVKEKHLPEIPSEQEVLTNGIELGKMNKLLLLKVEELTLYMIQMQKEIENLKNAE